MSREEFLENLRRELDDLPARDVEEIIEDYRSYFDEALAAGRAIEDVVAAHAPPRRLAQELRAEVGLRKWENHPTPANLWKTALALCGLAAADVMVLLPALLLLGSVALILLFVFSLLGVIGIGTLLDLASSSHDPAEGSAIYLLTRSVGLLAVSAGGSVLLVFALRKAMAQLAGYARLHYRLLRPGALDTSRPKTDDQGRTADMMKKGFS